MADRATASVPRPGAAGTTSKEKEAAADPLIGRVVNDKFKILGFIAKGGMGKVYRAEQAPLGRVCALKVLNANYTGEHDPEFHKRFFLEASMTSKLRHPNTVTIFDYGQTTDGVYYMAMEYLEGYTLHRAIRQVSHLPEERTAHIARQICRSLREAHSLGVVHRDLKPANVYLLEHGDEPDYVKVLDFGLVKDIQNSDAEELTQAGLFMGSPKYMAPEQIQGGTVDARTDIYALGIIMYEMMTGKVPFDAPKSLDILMAHVRDEVPPLKKMNPTVRVTPPMEETIFRCLAKDPKDRYRSMDEVIAALKRLGQAPVPEPSGSLNADRQSTTGSGPTASRIVPGRGAAMAVPLAAGSETDPASSSASQDVGPEIIGTPGAAPEPAHPYRLLAAVAGVLIVVGAIGYAKLHSSAPPPPGSSAAIGPQSATSVPAATTEPAKPVAEVDFNALTPTPSATASTAPAATTKPVAPGPAPGAVAAAKPHPGPAPVATPPKEPAKPAPAAAAPAKPSSDCNPSYYYDADGNKHFKPECFGK
jgi:serine/threonine-protein kinase